MWGCGDSGRLGLGAKRMEAQTRPVLVPVGEDGKESVASVSCGSCHTVISTVVMQSYVGGGDNRIKTLTGGRVYVAGSPSALGDFCPTFTLVKSLIEERQIIQSVSAGHCHSGALTTDGALFCWGLNCTGCCGQPVPLRFIKYPRCVRFLYDLPVNLALNKKATQSSTLGKMEAELAVDGKLQSDTIASCSCTRADNNAWWQVDLGDYCMVETVRVYNRTDLAEGGDPLKNIKRLFPCWIMAAREPYDVELYGGDSFEKAVGNSVAKKKFVDVSKDDNVTTAVALRRVADPSFFLFFRRDLPLFSNIMHYLAPPQVAKKLTWRLPERILCRYIRVQLESQNFLNLAHVEVMGNVGIPFTVGRVTSFQCGRNVTVAVVGPSTRPEDVRNAYKRAVQADSYNADLLRQYEVRGWKLSKTQFVVIDA